MELKAHKEWRISEHKGSVHTGVCSGHEKFGYPGLLPETTLGAEGNAFGAVR